MSRIIKFGDVQIGELAKQHVMDCLNTSQITMGDKVGQFEQEWGELFGYKHNLAVNSGTSADLCAYLCLYDLGAKRGDEIIVPALSFISTSNAVLAAGFTPVFCDINRYFLNIDETKVESLITDKTKAIVAVSTMGKPCKMDVLRDICDRHNLLLIADDCEGHGCSYKGRMMGNWADIATYSCYAAHLIFGGELGVVSTMRDDLAELVKSTRSHGRKSGDLFFNHERFGWNAKATNIHCAIGLESLSKFWDTFDNRKRNLELLIWSLKQIDYHLYFNGEGMHETTAPHALSMVFRKDDEERFLRFYKHLEDNGIQCKINFRSIPTQQPSFAWMGYKLGDFPEAEFVGRNGLHCGCHHYLTGDDLRYMINTILAFFD